MEEENGQTPSQYPKARVARNGIVVRRKHGKTGVRVKDLKRKKFMPPAYREYGTMRRTLFPRIDFILKKKAKKKGKREKEA